ncbi:MAG: hypothetical protein JNL71_16500 [Rhodospirillales bacterium]|nr:hypothetical protein [Rhodospirillales bacterium]
MTDRAWNRATLLLFAGAAGLVLATFRDYGVTWDEHFHDTYGKAVLRHFQTGFSDPAALTYFNLWLYGAAFDVTAAVAKRLLPFPAHEVQHLMIALAGLAGAAAASRIGHLAGGPRAGFLAGLVLLVTPSWWGHMFVNPKDIPFAAAMAWALYWSMRAALELPRPAFGTMLWLGLSLGLSLGIRVAGVYAFVYPAFAGALWLAMRVRARGPGGLVPEIAAAARGFAVAAALAYAVMLAAWPWALRDPLHRPIEALAVFAATPWDINVLFDGHLVSSMALPRDYLLVYLGAKLPIFVLAAALAALVAGLQALRAGGISALRPHVALLAFAILFPLASFAVLRPVTYDGIRHFLFVLPPLAAVAALGLDRLVAASRGMPVVARAALAAMAFAVGGSHALYLREIHPYQYAYYNALVGGMRGAAGRFELDYWGSSYREAALALRAHLATAAGGPRTVFVCAEGSSAAPFLAPELELTVDDRTADFYIATTRLDCDQEYEGETVLTVARDGAVLAVVKDRRALKRDAPERLDAHPAASALVAPRHPGL